MRCRRCDCCRNGRGGRTRQVRSSFLVRGDQLLQRPGQVGVCHVPQQTAITISARTQRSGVLHGPLVSLNAMIAGGHVKAVGGGIQPHDNRRAKANGAAESWTARLAGNRRVRHMLVEAAWTYRHPPRAVAAAASPIAKTATSIAPNFTPLRIVPSDLHTIVLLFYGVKWPNYSMILRSMTKRARRFFVRARVGP